MNLPATQIHDALQARLVEIGLRGAHADEVAAGMVIQIKKILENAKE